MEQVKTKLEDIISSFKSKKKLSQVEQQESRQLLTELFIEGSSWDSGVKLAALLPPEVGTSAIFSAWDQFDHQLRKTFVSEYVKINNLVGLAGLTRQIYLTGAFIKHSEEITVFLLKDLCEKVSETGSKIPNSRFLTTFRDRLVNWQGLLSITPQQHSFSDSEMTSVALVLISSLVRSDSSKVVKEDDICNAVISWIQLIGKRATLTKKIKKVIEEGTEYWSDLSKESLRELGLITESKPIEKKQVIPVVLAKHDFSEIKETVKSKFDKNEYLNWLKLYMEDLEGKVENYELELKKLRNQLETEKYMRKQVEEKVREVQTELEKNLVDKLSKENENRSFREKVSELEFLLLQKAQEHKNDVSQLIDMSEQESTFAAEEFKNKLTKHFKIEYMDFNEIRSESMTLELGENLRSQLEKIFSVLHKEGIKF